MRRRMSLMAGTMVTAAGLLGAPVAAHAATVWTVTPGQSIQAAVDAARPGDTISVAAGTYYETVLVQKNDITIRGAGETTTGTVLKPPATFPANICGTRATGICFRGTVEGSDGPQAHALAFITGSRLTGVRVDGFRVGVSLSATDGAQVSHVAMLNAASYGLTDTVSKNTTVSANLIQHAARAAIYIGNYNIPDANAIISANEISDGAYGISAYDTSGVSVSGNNVHDSCAGFFGFADSFRIPGGEKLTVTGNRFLTNNANCPGAFGFPEAVQGAGVILAGVTQSAVNGNSITGNVGPDPLSGGIVVVSSRKYDPAETVDESGISVRGNVARNNSPADLVWDGRGSNISFTGNACGTSAPAGLC